ncbi:MAG: T9SS type A sorting domain-containing protein [Bacteroidota bacterium]
MKNLLSIIIALILSIGISQAQSPMFARAITVGSYDTVTVCSNQPIKLSSKLSTSTKFDFQGNIPTGWSVVSAHKSGTVCGIYSPTMLDSVCWFRGVGRIYSNAIPRTYRVDYDLKLSNLTDTANGCAPFIGHVPQISQDQPVYLDIIPASTNPPSQANEGETSSGLITAIAHGNVTFSGDEYVWGRHSVYSKNEYGRIQFREWGQYTGGSWGVDNVEVFYNIDYDSVKWRCVENPSFFLNKDTTTIPGSTGTLHYIATVFKSGISYMDTLTVLVHSIPMPFFTIHGVGDTLVCAGTTEVFIAHIANATSYNWTLYYTGGHAFGSSFDSTISVSFDSLYSINNSNGGRIIIKGYNSCSSISDTLWIKTRPLENISTCYVEFDELTSKNKIVWPISNKPIDSIYIYRKIGTDMIKIGSSSYNGNFIDYNSNPPSQSYTYQISSTNLCKKEGTKSSLHSTMRFKITSNPLDNIYYFEWTAYVGVSFPFYNIYGVESNGNKTLIGSTNYGELGYNYYNPNPAFVNYFVGFDITTCSGAKTTYVVKSNYLYSNSNGVDEFEKINFNIYPNPANSQINVQINTNLLGSTYTITDQIGKVVLSGKLNAEKSTIELSNLSGGIYLFSIGNNAKQTFKVIKK